MAVRHSSASQYDSCKVAASSRPAALSQNKYNHQQQEQQHQVFVIGITNLFVSRCMNGPSNLTLLRAGQIVSEIGLAQMQSPNRFVLEMLSNQIQQNIRNDKTLTWADQNNLCLFTWCNKMIIDDKMHRGIK